MTNDDPLLAPLSIRGIKFRNRVMSTSHACGLEDHNAMPGERYQRYHEEKAKGGIGLTMFGGSAYVDVDSTWSSGQLNMSTDAVVPYLEQFSRRIHDAGAGIMIQLTHLGRRGETNTQNWLPTIAPSRVREIGHRSIPREMDKSDIRRVVKAFGDAAYRAKQGGLDGMETMIGGHLIGQFLSPVTNHRTDEFGGSMENRCRFGLMVHDEIRNRVGDDFVVGMRFPIDEVLKEGMDFDECVETARVFQRSGLVDYFNANYGRIDTELTLITDCMPGMASPIAPWLEVAGRFKQAVELPVFHAARITDIATARYAVANNLLDMVAMTRGHIADPQIVNKISSGNESRIRPCVGMLHCMGNSRPTCIHNPASGRDEHWPQVIARSDTEKKAVVVGGGPAGLEAARVLGERGHTVKVFEAAAQPGGQLRLAAAPGWRNDVVSIIDWRLNELDHLGVELELNRYVEAADVLAEEPDLVIVATGGIPDLEWLPGNELATSLWDVLSGTEPVEDSVLVYDGTGRHPALAAADVCADKGAHVSLYLLDPFPGAELDYGERIIWRRELAKKGIPIQADQRLVELARSQSKVLARFCNELTDEITEIVTDQVLVEHGTLPADDLFYEMQSGSNNDGVTDFQALLAGRPQPHVGGAGGYALFRIGDAQSSRNLAAAMFDALRLCSSL